MQHDDFTVALEDGRWVPCDHSRVLQQHFGLMNNGKVTIGAVGGGVIIRGDKKGNVGGTSVLLLQSPDQPVPSSALTAVAAAALVVREKTAYWMQRMEGGGASQRTHI